MTATGLQHTPIFSSAPSGARRKNSTHLHLSTSFTTALTYGQSSSSSNVGLLSSPTTLLNSSQAFELTSGKAHKANTNEMSVDEVVSDPAPKRLPASEEISASVSECSGDEEKRC